MKSNSKFLPVALSLTAWLLAQSAIPAVAQTTLVSQLATFDTPPTGSIFPGGDFDPNLDNAASCSGCWFGRPAASLTTYGHSTAQKTQGTGALRASVVGQGAGGSYSVNINGSPVELDTHFDYPLVATYSNNPAANGGVLDPRFTAIEAAVDSGQQALYNIEFDIIYDVDQMRSIPWQAPEETVDPETNGQFPQRYFWVGLFGQANDSFQFTGFDANTITPFSAEYDNNKFPVFNASFPLSALNFVPNSTSAFYSIGVLYNSVHGTLPATGNTTGAVVYFDNFRLTKIDPVGPIDYNNNGQADAGDWELFMAQYLVNDPPASNNPNALYDLIGDFGAAGANGVVDFHDLQKFQEFYTIANPGSAAVLFGTVPEPGAFALAAMSLLALTFRRSRRQVQVLGAFAAIVVTLLSQPPAQAQLIEGFETPGRWAANPGADPGATPITVEYTPNNATQGSNSLRVIQGSDNLNTFSWNAAINPSWTTGDSAWDVLRQAVRTGAEHYNLLADVTFDPVDLFDQGVSSLTVTLGLNFNGADIGTYAGEPVKFTNTAVIPLTQFDLPDSVDQGATGYSAQIGFTGDNPLDFPYGVYIDNIRLEQISTPDLLTLEIDRTSGIGTLKNLSTAPVSWDYFDVKSPGGSLNPANWSSLDDQNVGGANTWIEAGGSTATEIAEASLTGSHTLNPGQTLTIGGLYNNSINAEDLVFAIRREGGPLNRTYDQIVTYTGVAPVGCIAGDFSCSGSVGNDDLTLLLDSWGDLVPPVPAGWNPHPNVAPTAPGVGNDELTALLDNWGNVAGSGSLASTSVPEPATASLGLVIALVAGIVRRLPRS
jgi:hypothetical protein